MNDRLPWVALVGGLFVVAGVVAAAVLWRSSGALEPAASPSAPGRHLGDSVRDVVEDAAFRLEFEVERARYTAGEPIDAHATLTYLGDAPAIEARGSGSGLVAFSVKQVDGDVEVGPAMTDDCAQYRLVADEPVLIPFEKSGGFSPDDPNADFFETFFADPVLRLPPGTWELTAAADFYVGDCGAANPQVTAQTSLRIVVEP